MGVSFYKRCLLHETTISSESRSEVNCWKTKIIADILKEDMATHLKGVFVCCLILLILMEETNPVLAKKQKLKEKVNKLEKSLAKLEERLRALEKCQACSKIKELNDTINELQEKVDSKPAPAVTSLENAEILKADASYLEALLDFLKPVVQSNTQWKRCWQASQDGWEAATFHSHCDNKGPTVTIVRVDHKYIFGGYTSVSWGGDCVYHYDSAAFIFSLVNKPGWKPLKLAQTGHNSHNMAHSIHSCSTFGPMFGGGNDFYIADLASSNTKSFSNLGFTYSPPPGHLYSSPFAKEFLAGSFHFQPDEVEVFYQST